MNRATILLITAHCFISLSLHGAGYYEEGPAKDDGIENAPASKSLDPYQVNHNDSWQFLLTTKILSQCLHFTDVEKILDIGCGNGRLSRFIAQKHVPQGHLVGIDNNQGMIFRAQKLFMAPNISYLHADAMDYVAPEEYDLIVSFWTLHQVSDYAKVLKNITRSLKPGGQAFLLHRINMPLFSSIGQQLLTTEKWQLYQKDASALEYLSENEVRSALVQTGLSLKIFKQQAFPISIAPNLLVAHWLSIKLPIFDFLPKTQRAEFYWDILRKFTEKNPLNKKNELIYWMPTITILLQKNPL